MTLSREEHDGLLNELLSPDLDASRKTDILTSIRDHNLQFSTSYETLNKDYEKLSNDNSALVVANSKLFRQSGIVVDEPKKDEKKEFSQTVTLEQLEGKI